MSPREPIRIEREPQRLSDAAFEALRKAILDRRLVPGEWLRQEALAKVLGVSQITVREALNRLLRQLWRIWRTFMPYGDCWRASRLS